jgi:hypothetical protein
LSEQEAYQIPAGRVAIVHLGLAGKNDENLGSHFDYVVIFGYKCLLCVDTKVEIIDEMMRCLDVFGIMIKSKS